MFILPMVNWLTDVVIGLSIGKNYETFIFKCTYAMLNIRIKVSHIAGL